MVAAALSSAGGVPPIAHRTATFEVFTRRMPEGRRYGVVAGTARLIDAIAGFRFSAADIEALEALSPALPLSEGMRSWLAAYRFRGDIWGYPEGELFGAYSPILTVRSTFAEAVVLETLVLSILNHDCAVAAAASHVVEAARGRRLIEMGSRRTDPDAAVSAARSAILAGFWATSNLEAGRRFGIPTAGTAAHAFVLAHDDEATAFRSQLESQGIDTTLLVDTYDIVDGIRTAVEVAQDFGVTGPGAIRIDSGDLALEVKRARAQLDELGATTTRIVISGDLDVDSIAALVTDDLPIDAIGVGTSVVTGDGYPTASLTYKLVSIADADGRERSVAKRSVGKGSIGGAKQVSRVAGVDVISPRVTDHDSADVDRREARGRPVLRCFMNAGEAASVEPLGMSSARLQTSLRELNGAALRVELDGLSLQ
jgi:nicotinate phosphoribosyltransferase